MTKAEKEQIGPLAKGVANLEKEGGPLTPRLARFAVDNGTHNRDGLLLHGWDGARRVTAFISRHVMDEWASPREFLKSRDGVFRDQYEALGNRNLPAIERIVTLKYQRGPEFNRQHPFLEILLSDITESGEPIDVSDLA